MTPNSEKAIPQEILDLRKQIAFPIGIPDAEEQKKFEELSKDLKWEKGRSEFLVPIFYADFETKAIRKGTVSCRSDRGGDEIRSEQSVVCEIQGRGTMQGRDGIIGRVEIGPRGISVAHEGKHYRDVRKEGSTGIELFEWDKSFDNLTLQLDI